MTLFCCHYNPNCWTSFTRLKAELQINKLSIYKVNILGKINLHWEIYWSTQIVILYLSYFIYNVFIILGNHKNLYFNLE